MSTEKTPIQRLEEEYPTIASGYKKIMKEQYELFAKKMLDYGIHNISVGTQLETTEEKKLALTGIWFRTQDKMNHLKNLVLLNQTPAVADERVYDSYADLTNYGIISQLVERDMWKK